MKRTIFVAVAASAIALGAVKSGTAAAARQERSLPVFTAQQAPAGKTAFTKTCASCHMPDLSGNNEVPPLAGANFMSTWRTRTVKELFDYMSGAMPPGGPSQNVETYEQIVAFILQSNGGSAGSEPLTGTAVALIGSVGEK